LTSEIEDILLVYRKDINVKPCPPVAKIWYRSKGSAL